MMMNIIIIIHVVVMEDNMMMPVDDLVGASRSFQAKDV
jgi:hypothetical protein